MSRSSPYAEIQSMCLNIGVMDNFDILSHVNQY